MSESIITSRGAEKAIVYEAMDERRSRRLYLTEPINASLLSRLQNLIDTYNIKAHFKLATGGRFERGNPANYVL